LHEPAAAYGAAAEASLLSKATATPEPWSHPWLDQLGLCYHRAVAEKIRARPDLLRIAIDNIDRWLSQNDYPSGPRKALLEWRGILVSASQNEIVERMLDPSEAGHQRRQNTPFAGILSDEERKQIREKYEQATTR
jgi:hypothetical protein